MATLSIGFHFTSKPRDDARGSTQQLEPGSNGNYSPLNGLAVGDTFGRISFR